MDKSLMFSSDPCLGCNLKSFDIGYMCYKNRQKSNELYMFLTKHNVIPSVLKCIKCGKNGKINYKKGVVICNKVNLAFNKEFNGKPPKCGYKRTIFKGTFFDNVNLPKWKIVNFVYLYLSVPCKRISYLKDDLEISSRTYCDWSSYIREVLINWAIEHSSQIGGENVMVEIDEAKFGGARNKRGRIASGQWVLGGIECNNRAKQFFVPMANKNQENVIDLIKKYIKPGSIIQSNCSAALENISIEGFTILMMKHSLNFIDPVTRVHSQNIEKLWCDLRSNIPHSGRKSEHFTGYLAEARFRQTFKNVGDRFHEFWKAVSVQYPFLA